MTMTADETSPLDPDALFQVGDEQPVPFAHLERVNPELTAEQKTIIRALAAGKSTTFAHDGRSVRVRRTR
jgi:hypothetical protein